MIYVLSFCILLLFILCAYLLVENIHNRKNIVTLNLSMQTNLKVYKELFKLYTLLQDGQMTSNQGFEALLKQHNVNTKEFEDFKQHVSDAFVIITEYFQSIGKTNGNLMSTIKVNKLKSN